jgi:signal peptidase I
MQGDNNPRDDRMLYNPGQRWIGRSHIMGRAVGFVPYVGMVTIVMNDYPALKFAVIGALALLCLLGLDD